MQRIFVVTCIILISASYGFVQNLRGVHFDIEPYTLAVWQTNQTETFGHYVDLMEKLSAKLAGTGLDLAVDLPFFYYQYNYTRNNRTQPYHEWIIDRTDRVCSMDYRAYAYTNGQRTDGIVRNGMDYVNYATQVGKKVVIIVETTQQQPDYISFYGSTTTYMEQELALVHSNFSTKSGYDGLCIHHRDSWAAMTPDYNVTSNIPRDTFQWVTTAAIDPVTRPAYLEFCKRRNVRTVYLHAESLVKTNQNGLVSFIQSAATYGINVELLFGASNWALPAQHDYVLSLVDYAIQVADKLKAAAIPVLIVDPVNGSDIGNGPFLTIRGAVNFNATANPRELNIVLLPGDHKVTGTINFLATNFTSVKISAAVANSATVRCAGAGYRAFDFRSVPSVSLYGLGITNCTETAGGIGGGAVYIAISSSINISSCNFYGNTGRKGGALSVQANSTNPNATFVLENSIFSNNNASVSSGGALFTTMIQTRIINTQFTNNYAVSSGGGIAIYWESSGFPFAVTLENCVLEGNKAFAAGGAIYSFNPNTIPLISLTLKNSTVTSNSISGTGASSQGAGVYLNVGHLLRVVDSQITNNIGTKVSVNTQGGGIYAIFGANTGYLSVENSQISGNKADLAGGIFLTNRLNPHAVSSFVTNSHFFNNTGAVNIGAFLTSNNPVTIENSTFEGNFGGNSVVAQNGAIVNFRSSIIRNHTQGGFYCDASTFNFFESSIHGNTLDFSCAGACTVTGTTNMCAETCAYRDICSKCDGDLSLTCAANCANSTWTSRQKDCPIILPPDDEDDSDDFVRVNVKITVSVAQIPTRVSLANLIVDVTQVLGIPRDSIGDVTVDLDRSSDSQTVVTFTLWNAPIGDTSRVDSIGAAYNLKKMAETNDASLQETSYLAGMSVIDYNGHEVSAGVKAVMSYLVAICLILLAA